MKEKPQKVPDELLASKRRRAAAQAQHDVLQQSEGLRPEAFAAIQSPATASSAGAAPTRTRESVKFLAVGLMEYAQLSTRLITSAQSSCGQPRTIVVLARQTSLPQFPLEDLLEVDRSLPTRLTIAYARFKMDLIAAAQQPGWVAEVGLSQMWAALALVPA